MDDQRTNQSGGRMRYRKLRIAFTILCGVACVLLFVFHDQTVLYPSYNSLLISLQTRIVLESFKGQMAISLYDVHQKFFSHLPSSQHAGQMTGVLGFGYSVSPTGMPDGITYPHWFAILVFATLSVVPWIKWRIRFGIRTLLVAMTLLAVALGVVAYATRNN